jgi:hypothetical protein
LSQEDGRARNLNTQITTGHHDTVRLCQDVIKVVNSLATRETGRGGEEKKVVGWR